ncbi:tetratricopeptide repeat protein [Geomobilimonas luticola]|uniref:Tetratricopeptide repeat protein n=1 Tax=Geomobilimonas luticola TaxID=1114878 RepID=A0ABS5SGY2_9BACT|nr:tetratricopeptide repeat protein [Geomobilimonas luticola]
MKKEQILVAVIALVAGLLLGILFFGGKKDAVPVGGGVPMGGGAPADYQQRIAEVEKIVAREPGNVQAWIQLGNDYFDTDQTQKSINAYGKALELDPNNTNVLTDQGVMYRKMGWFDKAIANFEKAQKLDPKHLQSLYNLGVVYAQDLKQPAKAAEVWERYLKMDSTSPTAQQIKAMMEQFRSPSGK